MCRRAAERERVALARTIVEREGHDRQDVRPCRIEDERLVEGSPGDRAALRPEPAGPGDLLEVEPLDSGRDLGARAQVPVLIITCLMNV
jgi:hypothetical protein